MQVSISASGTADQVKNAVATQIKQAGKTNEAAWPALVSLRGYIGAQVDAADAGSTFTLSASVAVSLTTKPAAKAVVEDTKAVTESK